MWESSLLCQTLTLVSAKGFIHWITTVKMSLILQDTWSLPLVCLCRVNMPVFTQIYSRHRWKAGFGLQVCESWCLSEKCQVICRIPFYGNLLDIFLMIRLQSQDLEEYADSVIFITLSVEWFVSTDFKFCTLYETVFLLWVNPFSVECIWQEYFLQPRLQKKQLCSPFFRV